MVRARTRGDIRAAAEPERVRAPLTPTPDGTALVVEVECRTSPTARRGDVHAVTIEPDWSVTTPHDLEAERVAAAFGGYTSCVVLADRTVPAFRESVELLTRRSRPALRRDRAGAWRIPADKMLENCCSRMKFSTAEKALRHLRTPEHLARAHDAPDWQLRQVYDGAREAWSTWRGRPSVGVEVASLVREVAGVDELWRCGLPPEEVVALAAQVPMVTEPLPIAYFLAMAYGEADPEWLRAALRHHPDPDIAAWLADLDRADQLGDGDSWGRWLAHGLPRNDARVMVGLGTAPELVDEGVRATGWRPATVARVLADWGQAGCHPGVVELAVLAAHGSSIRPSGSVLDEILAEIGSLVRDGSWPAVALSRTEVAVMYAVLGSRAAVLGAIQAGVRGVEGLERYVEAVSA